jgi:hypothetical protein
LPSTPPVRKARAVRPSSRVATPRSVASPRASNPSCLGEPERFFKLDFFESLKDAERARPRRAFGGGRECVDAQTALHAAGPKGASGSALVASGNAAIRRLADPSRSSRLQALRARRGSARDARCTAGRSGWTRRRISARHGNAPRATGTQVPVGFLHLHIAANRLAPPTGCRRFALGVDPLVMQDARRVGQVGPVVGRGRLRRMQSTLDSPAATYQHVMETHLAQPEPKCLWGSCTKSARTRAV